MARYQGGNTGEALARELAANGVRASYQRLRILQYLREAGGHPTADEIYRGLARDIPTLAKATVYNTLHAFVTAGLVRVAEFEDTETRYDAILAPHGHFRCDACGRLADFGIAIDRVPVEGLDRFHVRVRNVVFRGTCPDCLAVSHTHKE